ncbi:AAA family ATPase [Aneurinibacillus tyrosinisolvens]|uniref:AAA family ATPase n=1 Tax=Aneurinibacillus tyrosinisolvens TaxID=1443435 RepID=UPI00063F71DB|nr:AAA family ATPase [Aneurinibacillus tyrosinisolvens]
MPVYLRSVEILEEKVRSSALNSYPFTIPTVKTLNKIEFTSPITFFVGENGSGKSTLLEAIAYKCEFNTAGGSRNNTYEVESSNAALGEYVRLSWLPKINHGFFLRAESFYHFASHLDQLAREDRTFRYQGYGGKSLHHQSHGESFLSLFINRFGKKGIYLLDEPEAALSPSRQLSFLRLLHEMNKEGNSQFIIATHSPILLGYPDTQILNFDTAPISPISYEETSHYFITRHFLEKRKEFLNELFAED